MDAIIRPSISSDRLIVRSIFGSDEFARTQLLEKYPLFGKYLADEMAHYPDFEPESMFVS
jgi:hypothetical protein